MTQEALKLALDALENHTAIKHPQQIHYRDKAITAIKEALAQTELCKYGQEPASCTSNPMDCQCAIDASLAQTQEPVAWFRYQQGSRVYYDSKKWDDCQPLYTSPPQRTQVDLTDEEVFGLFGRFTAMTGKSWLDLYRMTEAKRKEKNI